MHAPLAADRIGLRRDMCLIFVLRASAFRAGELAREDLSALDAPRLRSVQDLMKLIMPAEEVKPAVPSDLCSLDGAALMLAHPCR